MLSAVLGVEPGVSDENLKRAYRRAAVKWHPDKNTGNVEQAEKRFKEIQEVGVGVLMKTRVRPLTYHAGTERNGGGA